MKKELIWFKRYVYIADPHGSELFVDFINKYNDWVTKFYILWDIFDRWECSYEIIEKIKVLWNEGKLDMVLWNHDLFFLMWFWLHYWWDNIVSRLAEKLYWKNNKDIERIWEIFYKQFYLNKGWKTIDSFERWYWKDRLKEKTNGIVNFLWQFNLSKRDDLGNYLVHGGIPILEDGSVIWEENIWEFLSWIKYVEKINSLMKNLDIITLEKLSAEYHHYAIEIYDEMNKRGLIIDEKISWYQVMDYPVFFSPTWFGNSFYTKLKKVFVALRWELNRNNIKRLIVWHWFNTTSDFSNLNSPYAIQFYNTVICMERCGIVSKERKDNNWNVIKEYSNFGYCVINIDNEVIEIWDAKDVV